MIVASNVSETYPILPEKVVLNAPNNMRSPTDRK